MYIRYPLSPRQDEDLMFERGIDICQETVRLWWRRFGPIFAAMKAVGIVERQACGRDALATVQAAETFGKVKPTGLG